MARLDAELERLAAAWNSLPEANRHRAGEALTGASVLIVEALKAIGAEGIAVLQPHFVRAAAQGGIGMFVLSKDWNWVCGHVEAKFPGAVAVMKALVGG